jgi:hypothetical protein
MRVTTIMTQRPRNRLDRSVRRAEKRRCRARTLRVRGPIRPVPGVCATADAARGEKSLFSGQSQAILTSDGRPLGECRFKPEAIREIANAEFSKPVHEQDPETLETIAKEANIYSNLVTKITDEYNDYLRDNSRYDFVTEEVRKATIVAYLLNLDSEFKTFRNQAYLNLGFLSQAEGREMEAFLYFNDAFRLSAFDCPDGIEQCIRYQAEQQMKTLLNIGGDSYVYWKK